MSNKKRRPLGQIAYETMTHIKQYQDSEVKQTRKYDLMRATGTTHTKMTSLLELLVDGYCIEKDDKQYRLTDAGNALLILYNKTQSILNTWNKIK